MIQMKHRQREAVVGELAKQLRSQGSWCGETHLQKATYVLERLFEVPLQFGHVLYKYGPFADDLRDELTIMRADGFLEQEIVLGYGPRLKPTPAAEQQLFMKWPKTLRLYESEIGFVAKCFGDRGVGELERLATALWVRNELPDASHDQQATRLCEIKRHVSRESALKSLATVEQWESDASALVSAS